MRSLTKIILVQIVVTSLRISILKKILGTLRRIPYRTIISYFINLKPIKLNINVMNFLKISQLILLFKSSHALVLHRTLSICRHTTCQFFLVGVWLIIFPVSREDSETKVGI